MKILAIETSCDETAVAILEGTGDTTRAKFTVLGEALLSQIDVHQEFGGVFPNLARREHQRNLLPLVELALKRANLLEKEASTLPAEAHVTLSEILDRETETKGPLLTFLETYKSPGIDAVAVTYGPGLEPALWVGLNVAKALALGWQKPLVPINHMEGHVLSSLIKDGVIENVEFPVLALLISGGHTELVLMKDWLTYELIGQTLDDAVGEAFDKVARMLQLPYPGGPQISALAEKSRQNLGREKKIKLPRPMLHSNTCDFSFSGLKTSVLYLLREYPELTPEIRELVSEEFEDSVTDVLVKKTQAALTQTGAQTVLVGGGVSANTEIRRRFQKEIANHEVAVAIPDRKLSTDNAVMIAIAAFYRVLLKKVPTAGVRASGSLSLSSE